MHRHPDIIVVHHLRLTGVEPDTHPHVAAHLPAVGGEGELDGLRRSEPLLRTGEDGEHSVPRRLHLHPAAGIERHPDEPEVIGYELGEPGTEPLRQHGGALHIGEEEGHRPNR